jgi:hypothetical protein
MKFSTPRLLMLATGLIEKIGSAEDASGSGC